MTPPRLVEDEMGFEMLFEALMREKNREELVKLESDFFDEALRYIEQEELLVHPSNHTGFQRARNLRNMIRELYSRREQKIIRLATMSSRGSQIDRAAMLDQEKTLYTELSQILEHSRKKRLESAPAPKKAKPKREEPQDEEDPEPVEAPKPANPGKVGVIFTKPVSKFLDEELAPHGPFDEGDEAQLPEPIARILLEKGEVKMR